MASSVASVSFGQGQAVAWGYDSNSQASVPAARFLRPKRVSAGNWHSAYLSADGTVRAWGLNELKQCVPPPSANALVEIVSGGDAYSNGFNIGRTAQGEVVCWGSNATGETSAPLGLSGVVQVAASLSLASNHAMALLADGSVEEWGADHGVAPSPGDARIVQVDCGRGFSIARLDSGRVLAWGSPPASLDSIENARTIAAGYSHVVAIHADGSASTWGSSGTPVGVRDFVQADAGAFFSVAVTANGRPHAWGSNSYQQLNVPVTLTNVVQVACGFYHTVALVSDGSIAAWGYNGDNQCRVPPVEPALFTTVHGGALHSIGVRDDGVLVCWGTNWGDVSRVPSDLTPVRSMSIGHTADDSCHVVALQSDGKVRSWGDGRKGQLIDGKTGVSHVAAGGYHTVYTVGTSIRAQGDNGSGQSTAPSTLRAWAGVAAGLSHSLAWDTDGALIGWGKNTSGQRSIPPGLPSVRMAAAGRDHTVVALVDGGLRCLGSDGAGQCSPPAGLGSVTQVACGRDHSVALLADSSVVCWGDNSQGQCAVPGDGRGFAEISAGWKHTLAIMDSDRSGCAAATDVGTATISNPGGLWQDIAVWRFDQGSPRVPASGTVVDFGPFGSIGSECSASAATVSMWPGSSLLVSPRAAEAGNDFSIRVGSEAKLAGRLWLLGTPDSGATLPENLDVPVLSAGTVSGCFDLIQSDLAPPPGRFLTVVPTEVNGRTVLSLRLLPLTRGAGLTSAGVGSFSGSAVAAETIDINHDGLDDLALAVDFGPGRNGLVQVLLNDGAGNLGIVSVVESIPPEPTCIAAGDLDGDGRRDLVVGVAGDASVHSLLDDGEGGLVAGPVTSISGASPTSVIVMPSPAASATAGASIGVGTSKGKFAIFRGGALQQEITMAGTVQTVRGGDTGGRSGTDIVTGGRKSASFRAAPGVETGFVQILMRHADGTLAVSQTMELTGIPVSMDVADLDGDGLDDIVTANADPVIAAAGGARPVLSVFRNTEGRFSGGVSLEPVHAAEGLSVTLVDADSDGDRDIVAVYDTTSSRRAAALLRVDTLGAGTPISVGETTELEAFDPRLTVRGNLDGTGGDDVFLVDAGSGTSLTGGGSARPYLGTSDTRRADIDGNGVVDYGDVTLLLLNFGPCENCRSDLDGSGYVDFGDLNLVMLDFG